jgi:hypothetical protein
LNGVNGEMKTSDSQFKKEAERDGDELLDKMDLFLSAEFRRQFARDEEE